MLWDGFYGDSDEAGTWVTSSATRWLPDNCMSSSSDDLALVSAMDGAEWTFQSQTWET